MGQAKRRDWEDYEDDLLRHHWKEKGLSASKIAERVMKWRTAGQITGRLTRLGLKRQPTPYQEIWDRRRHQLPEPFRERRDLTGQLLGDPQPDRSALAQRSAP